MSRSLAHGELGFRDRLENDATFVTLVGTDADGDLRLHGEFVGERVLGLEDDYRAVTYFRVTPHGLRRLDTGELRIQSDVYVAQAFGGSLTTAKARLEAIDTRMLELIDEAQWIYEGVRLNGVALPEREPVGGHLRPLRRTRDWLVGVN